jgi:uncharacterized protein (DUF885 family)
MARFSQRLLAGLVFLALGGCGSAQSPQAAPAAGTAGSPKEQLNRLVERYWDERIPAESAVSPQVLADSLAVERRYLNEVNALSRDGLDANSRLTFDIFKRRRELLIEGFTFPGELLPLGQLPPLLQAFELLSADAGRRPWPVADYDNWLKRLDDVVEWSHQAVQNMREGTRRGYRSPTLVVEQAVALLAPAAQGDGVSVLRMPLRSMPASIGEPERTRLKNSMTHAIDDRWGPAMRALHDFLQHDYLPRSRPGMALTQLPLGDRWYAYRIRRATGAALVPDEIHTLGVLEVERLRSRLSAIREAGPQIPLTADQLPGAYQDLIPLVEAAMPPLFTEAANAPLEVRGSEWLADPEAPLQYVPGGLLGKSPPTLYVNIAARPERAPSAARLSMASFLRQALPGRHLQAALAQQRVDLPRFRRNEMDSAFEEGWALYAVSLGEQLGLLTDDAAKADALMVQLRCAAGAVVDTGIHAKGWTQKQALDYLHAQLAIEDAAALALLGRYAANPADALACEIGAQKFANLRTKAQQSLGGRFDIRAFHTEILKDGAMPLDILEAKMQSWMDAAR